MLSEGVGGAVLGEAALTAVSVGCGTMSGGDGEDVCAGAEGNACAIAEVVMPYPPRERATNAHAPRILLGRFEGDSTEFVICGHPSLEEINVGV